MTRFYYGKDCKGKLVRDNIYEIIRTNHHEAKTRQLDCRELAKEILNKIPEELSELLVALEGGDIAEEKEELADLITLIDAYTKARQFDTMEIEKIKQAKNAKKGAFDKGIFIEYVDLNPESDDYDFWCSHFRKNSDRYIEDK